MYKFCVVDNESEMSAEPICYCPNETVAKFMVQNLNRLHGIDEIGYFVEHGFFRFAYEEIKREELVLN